MGWVDEGGPKPVRCGCTVKKIPEPVRVQIARENRLARMFDGWRKAAAKAGNEDAQVDKAPSVPVKSP